MSSIVVSRSGDFCVIVQQLLGRADDRSREPRPVQYVKNLGQNSRIRDVRAVPRQQIVYVMVSNHRDMKGVDARRKESAFLYPLASGSNALRVIIFVPPAGGKRR